MKRIFLLVVLFCALSSCTKGPGQPAVPVPPTPPVVPVPPVVTPGIINNAGFESDAATQTPANWQTEGDAGADYTEADGANGSNYALVHKKSTPYKVYTYQKVTGLANGFYTLVASVKNSGNQNFCYLSAKTTAGAERMTALPVTAEWKQVIIRGIEVTDGLCTVGINSDANGNDWCKVDNFLLSKDDKAYQFLKGADVSELSYIESKGGKFLENSVAKDCFTILKNNGVNLVRLRLYNDPGNAAYTPSNRLPPGFQNATDVLSLAARAKAAGMQIQLTFHYSDYWTNAGTQTKPHDWAALDYGQLKQAVYDFTFGFMDKMKAQGTTPEYVSLGNETAGGILFPDGDYKHFSQMADLFNKGYDAVKAVSNTTKVIIHLDDAGNAGKYDWFFDNLKTAGARFDIIGASYYPFWTNKTVTQIRDWANSETLKYNKDILIMESGYNWNPTLPSGYAGQLANNGPYQNIYPSSPEGQRDFMYDLFNGLKQADRGSVIGDIYWDPVMIAVPGVGWELGAPNVVANTTLFDFNGNVLSALKAFRYNN